MVLRSSVCYAHYVKTVPGRKTDVLDCQWLQQLHNKIARMFYRMWTDAGQYSDPGMDYYEQRYQEQALSNLRKKAQSLGFELVPQSTPTECVF